MKTYARALPIFVLLLCLGSAGRAEAPEIRAGSELDFRPYCFTDLLGRPTGFGVDLLRAAAGRMGLHVSITTGTWDRVWNDLAAGRLDVLPMVARTPGREPLVDFCLPHTQTFDAFFVRKGRPVLTDISSAVGKEIVVLSSDAAHHELLEHGFRGTIIPVESVSAGLRLVAAGRHDAFLCSKLIGTLEAKQSGITELVSGPPIPDYKRVFSFAVRKGDADLREKLDQGLRIVKESGEYDRIYARWLTGEEAPSYAWWGFVWQAVGIFGILILIAVTWFVARRVFATDMRQAEALAPQSRGALSASWRYALAILAVIAGHAMRIGIESWVGPGLPTFITYYPAVMIAALLGGIGPGLTATAVTSLIASIFLMKPIRSPEIISPVDRVALALFCVMGLLMTAFAELYRRSRIKAAAFDRDAALRESEGRFRALTETSSLAVGVSSPEGKFLYLNKAYEKLFGYTLAELEHVNASELWHDPEGRHNMIDDLRSRGFLTDYEAELKRKDGTPFWAMLSLNPVDYGGNQAVMASVYDITDRKRAEEALRASEERFRTMFERHGAAMLLVEPETGAIVDANASAAELYGYSRERLRSMNIDQINQLPPEQVAAARLKAIETGKLRFVFPHRRADGQIRWVEVYSSPVAVQDALLLFSVIHDITDRREAEEALERTRNTLAEAQEIAHLGSFEFVAATQTTVWSEEEYRIYGLDPAGPSPTYDVMLRYCIHPDDAALLHTTFTKAMRDHTVYELEHRIVRPDGSVGWVYDRALPSFDERGELIRYVGATLDITGRKRVEEALRESEEKFKIIATNTPDHILVQDTGLRYELVINPQLGLTEGDMIGKTDHDFLAEKDADFLTKIKKQVLETGKAEHVQYPLISRDGSIQYFEGYYIPRRDAAGGINGLIGYFQNVTERRQGEEALRLRTAELARSNEELQQFAYVASHDLQEPLRAVSGFLKLLDERYKTRLDEKAREFIDFAVEGASRMSQLVRDLLEYSRVASKGTELLPTDAERALAKALANLHVAIQESEAAVTHDELPAVMGDPTQVMQLFQNLVGNAIKFCAPDRPCRVHVSARKEGDMWEFAVRDNGIGIPADAHDRIFVIFQRLHARDRYGGTGIGLAICKKIVERHGGTIRVESTPGEGSAFLFTLPEVRP